MVDASVALVFEFWKVVREWGLSSVRPNICRFTVVNSSENEGIVYPLNWCSGGTCELCVSEASFTTQWLCCLKVRAY